MIKIMRFRSLGEQNYEVKYQDADRTVYERRFRVRSEPINGNGGSRLKLLSSTDTGFHRYIGSNPEFKKALFRLADAERLNSPVVLPLALP